MKEKATKSRTTSILKAHKRPFLASCFHLTGDSTDVSPFPITCYQHNLSGTQECLATYLHSDIPVLLIGPVASCRVVSICWKLRQRQLYDNPPPSSLAFRQRRGIAARIEAMGFGGKPIRRRRRIPPDPGGDPNNVSGKRPCRPVA